MKTKTTLGLGFGGQVLLSVSLGTALLIGLSQVTRQFSLVHQYDAPVIANGRRLAKLVVDMETGQRGFCIVQSEEFLASYLAAAAEFEELLVTEKRLIRDNLGQLRRLGKIGGLVDVWKTEAAEPEIAMARRVALATVDAKHLQDVLKRGVGQNLMERIMALGHEIETAFSSRGDWQGAFAVEVIEKCMTDREAGQRGFLITGKEDFLQKFSAGEQEALPNHFSGLRAIVARRGRGAELSKMVDELERLTHEWGEKAAEPEIAARREMNGRPESLKDVASLLEAGTGRSLSNKIRYEINRFVEVEERLAARRYEAAFQMAATTERVAIGLLLVALLFGTAIAVRTSRAIATPMAELAMGADRLGSGDLEARVHVTSTTEIAELGRAFNTMATKLEQASLRRREAENELRDSSHYASNVVKSIMDPLVVIDALGGIKTVNQAALDLLEYDESELLGEPIGRILESQTAHGQVDVEQAPADSVLFTAKRITELLHRGFLNNLEVDYVTRSQVRISMILSAAVMRDRDATISNIVCIAKNMTARKQAEESMLTIQKLESLGVMAGGIAHDFNNIMTCILGNLSVAKGHVEGGSEVRELITEAQDACQSARGLTHQLLTFASGGAPVTAVTELNVVLQEACTFAARGSRSRCIFSFDDGVHRARADRGQLAQVFQNLVINAYQAMPQGGPINVAVSRVELSEADLPSLPGGSYLKVTVRDSGVGILADRIGKVFDPYFSTKDAGRGLGLATCHSIVTKHGGHIGVASQPNEGTTFTIHLPSAEMASLPCERRTAIANAGSGRVLIMDDQPAVARALTRIVEKLGYDCETVPDGSKMLDACKTARNSGQPFDVVIMDLTIPDGMGGKEAVGVLKACEPDTRAIVSSGYSNDPIMADHAAYGFAGVLAKPYNVEEVSTVLSRTVQG